MLYLLSQLKRQNALNCGVRCRNLIVPADVQANVQEILDLGIDNGTNNEDPFFSTSILHEICQAVDEALEALDTAQKNQENAAQIGAAR